MNLEEWPHSLAHGTIPLRRLMGEMGDIPKDHIGLQDVFITIKFQIAFCVEWPAGIFIPVKFPNRDVAIRKLPRLAIKGPGNNPDALTGGIIAHKPEATRE